MGRGREAKEGDGKVLAGRSARAREDGSAVAVGVVVDDLDGLVEGVGAEDRQDGTEELLGVTLKENRMSEVKG